MPEDPTVVDVRAPGLVGLFARPAAAGRCPAIVAFGGSSGGLGPSIGWAPELARSGFAVLALAYFAFPGCPESLLDIEVEVVERGVQWLFDEGHADGDTVGVMGISRGSELALLASVLVDRVGPVVAFAPSHVSWSALTPAGPVDAPAWTFRGDALPYVAIPDDDVQAAMRSATPGAPFALCPLHEAVLADPARWSHAEIAVEDAKGPVLLVSGEDDAMWPSTTMAKMIEQRAAQRGSAHAVTHLHYPEAGHASAGVPNATAELQVDHPITGVTYALGGTTQGNANARAASWPRVLDHFNTALPRP